MLTFLVNVRDSGTAIRDYHLILFIQKDCTLVFIYGIMEVA